MHINVAKNLRVTVFILFVVVLGWYTWIKVAPLAEGPEISLSSHENGSVVYQSIVTIAGTAPRSQKLFLNGYSTPLFNIDEFEELFALAPGYQPH